ncbi:putative zinc-binding oxidoreductase ToxD [Mollisia scopiformis]|uniref:Putative zinc-binding oxidoreductase ToxD n=1 Tax=Mollisia scopiformis TaxID=149040 RepID=A0A132B803_MOLSC|nr:putative zinc-binding oxidoreductase ToxD [Mollisia scopiformis]KUJ08491.1 putative zinc-binding oxidoreductase ToxD [Mollisia scopiformis]
MALPKEMQALVLGDNGGHSVKAIPLPKLRPSYVLIKVESIALNPTDWKHAFFGRGAIPFSILGCDYAGTVISIGAEVTKPFKVGDRVYGCAHGGNFNEAYDGVFAEYAMVKGDVAMHEPTSSALDLSDLCTIPLGSITVGQGLFQPDKGLALAWPDEEKEITNEWLLIYGGSTATGSLGIQFAKLAGYKIITTCSPRNNDLVKSRGADEVLDYNDPECGHKIRLLTKNKLRYAWDTIGSGESAKICHDSLSDDPSIINHYGSILMTKFPGEGAICTFTLMYTLFGEDFFKYGKNWPASKEDYEFGKKWMNLTEKLVAEGKLKPHSKRVGSGGFDGILKGMDDLRAGKLSGKKMVYFI